MRQGREGRAVKEPQLKDSKIKELASFGAAALRLRLLVNGPLHHVEAYLAEDNQTVLLIAPNGDGYETASFLLATPTTEEEFDGHEISDLFNDPPPLVCTIETSQGG